MNHTSRTSEILKSGNRSIGTFVCDEFLRRKNQLLAVKYKSHMFAPNRTNVATNRMFHLMFFFKIFVKLVHLEILDQEVRLTNLNLETHPPPSGLS